MTISMNLMVGRFHQTTGRVLDLNERLLPTIIFLRTFKKKADSDENGKKGTSEEQRNPEVRKNERAGSNEEATTGTKVRKRPYSSFLKKYIRGVKNRTPNEGLITVSADFKEPYPLCTAYERIASLILHLVITYVYNNFTWKRAMFTIGYKIRVESGVVSFTIGTAIHLNRSDSSGIALPNKEVFNHIWELIVKEGEIYRDNEILGVFLRVYIEKRIKKNKNKRLSAYEVDSYISKLVLLENSMRDIGKTSGKVSMLRQRDSKSLYITALKPSTTELKSFIVADLETVLVESQNDDDYHVPYAAGLLPVHPGEDVESKPNREFSLYFSEDIINTPDFEDRSKLIMTHFLKRLEVLVRERKMKTVYLHNLGRFDGLLMMKFLVSLENYTFESLVRNNIIYEIRLYPKLDPLERKKGDKRTLLFRIRDSYLLLPGSLAILSKTLCPELGSKGDINHKEVVVSNLQEKRADLMVYLKQDIRLLGGILVAAQKLFFNAYGVDIVDCMTTSSLSLRIFRMRYFDADSFPIPRSASNNVDSFIRRAYYGGHAEAYIPKGTNLYYYDVNSLYPYVMQNFDMPAGHPIWYRSFDGMDLSDMYGFIEALVRSPEGLNRPFLPYRSQSSNLLLFPTGEFKGVYFSEELKCTYRP